MSQGPINASIAHTVTSNSLNVGADLKDTAVGVSYDFKVAKLAVAHRQFKMLNAKQANLLIGAVTAPVGSGEFKASYNRGYEGFGGHDGYRLQRRAANRGRVCPQFVEAKRALWHVLSDLKQRRGELCRPGRCERACWRAQLDRHRNWHAPHLLVQRWNGGANAPLTTLLSSQAPHHIVVAGPFFVIARLGRRSPLTHRSAAALIERCAQM